MPVTKGSVFNPEFKTRLVNGTTARLADSVVVYPAYKNKLQIILNSAFNAFVLPATAQQPMFYDQLRALYGKTTVTAALIQITPVETDATISYEMIAKITQGDELSLATTAQGMTLPNMTHMINDVKSAQATDRVVFKRYVNMARFFAGNKMTEDKFSEEDVVLPTAAARCVLLWQHRHVGGQDLAAKVQTYKITLTQWITFSERKGNVIISS